MSLERAIAIAAEAHAGQVDKAGAPYILHPLRVMLAVPDDCKEVAVLHDVVEDCSAWTFERLQAEGFHPIMLSALFAVTRQPGEAYADFIERAAANPIGRKVKLADLRDNMDLSRFKDRSQINWQKQELYAASVSALIDASPAAPQEDQLPQRSPR